MFKGPRERLLELGAPSLSDAELLCILLRTGKAQADKRAGLAVVHLAETILNEFRSLKDVLSASKEELGRISGLGPAKVATLLCVKELSQRIWKQTLVHQEAINTSRLAYGLFCDLVLESQEVLCAAFLNNQNKLIRKQSVFKGLTEGVLARPREVIREAIRANASKLIIAHNHPSENPEPSEDDLKFTWLMDKAAALVGISFVDHLIVCSGGRYFSFADSGRLRSDSREGREKVLMPRTK